MRRLFLLLLAGFLLQRSLTAQTLAPAPQRMTPEQLLTPKDMPVTLSKSANCNRQAIIDDYNNNYLPADVSNADLAWTGSVPTCTPGATSAISKTRTLARINYFRRLVGLADNMTLDQASYETKCQAAALIMDANNMLNHFPPNNWTCWTQAGYDGAGSSNIALGAHSAQAISLFIADPGSGNTPAGHRRWILYSRSTVFGTGSTSYHGANDLYVFGPTATPASLPEFIAYPTCGYFPRSLMPYRWSFGIPGANFSAAKVKVQNEAGDTIALTKNAYAVGYGDNTLTWDMPNAIQYFTGDADVIFTVTISGITNAPQSTYTYKIIAVKETTAVVAFNKTDPTCIDNSRVVASFPPGPKSWQWSTGSTADTIANLPVGNYTVTVTDRNDCTLTATVTLVDSSAIAIVPGDAQPSTATKSCDGTVTLNLNTTGAKNLKPIQVIGWWITKDKPASTLVSSQPTLNAALAQAKINPAAVVPTDTSFVYSAGPNPPFSKTFSCGTNLESGKNYYATPLVSLKESPAPTAFSTNTTDAGITIKNFSGSGPGVTNIPVTVYQMPTDAKLVQVCLQIHYVNFATFNDLSIQLKNPAGNIIYLASYFPYASNYKGNMDACFVDDNTGWDVTTGCNASCYTGKLNSTSVYVPLNLADPNGAGTLIVTDSQNPGSKPDYISVNLVFDKPAFAYVFPTVDYNKCILGTPFQFTCSTVPFIPPTISGQTQFCSQASGSLDAGSGYDQYVWNSGASTRTIQPTGTGNYTVTVTDAQGCTGTASVAVNVNPNPTVSIAGGLDVCAGNSAVLDAGSGYTSYLWSTGQSTQNISPQQTGAFSVTATDAHGCTGTATVQVNVHPNPTPTIDGQTSICQGAGTMFDAGQGFSQYAWSNGATTQSISTTQGGAYTVTVTNANGCTNTATATLTVNPPPVIALTPAAPVCQGSSTGLDAGPGFTHYLWDTGATTQTLSVNQAGNYTVTVTDVHNCIAQASTQATIYPLPTVNITGTTSFCQGSVSPVSATAGFASYHWSSGSTTASLTAQQSGNYTVTATDAHGCSATASVGVTVNPQPTVSISGPASFCQGSALPLTATGGATYHWSDGSSGSSFTPMQSGNYTVTATSANGCTNTATTTVEVYPLPAVQITGILNVCQGNPAQLNASPGLASYHWTNGATTQTLTVSQSGAYTVTVTDTHGCSNQTTVNVSIYTAPPVSIAGQLAYCSGNSTPLTATAGYALYHWNTGASTGAITVQQTGAYTVTVIDINGCSNTATVNVNVKPSPIVQIDGPQSFCQGAGTLEATAGYFYYQWNTGGNTNTVNPQQSGTYTVTVTANNFCSTTATATVTVFPSPTPVIMGAGGFCVGDSIQLTVAAGFQSYQWNTGQSVQAITVHTTGSYTVTVSNAQGCTATTNKQITAYAYPTVDLGAPVFIHQGQQATLYAPAGNGFTYQWSTGDVTQTIMVSAAGTYTVTVTSSHGCSSTDNVAVIVTTGTQEQQEAIHLVVSPNPAIDYLLIHCIDCNFDRVELIDNLGRFIRTEKSGVPQGDAMTLQLEAVPSGLYYVKVYGEGFVKTVRVVKE